MHAGCRPSRLHGSFVVALGAIALVAIGCGPSNDGRGSIGQRSDSPGGCNPTAATRMVDGKTYVFHHFSFDAPATWRADGSWWDDGASLDPSMPQRRADVVVGLGEEERVDASRVEVSEDPTTLSPSQTLDAWKAGFAADHLPGCNATFDTITFRCDAAVMRTVRCADGLGLLSSHHTRLAVFHGGETFTVSCDIAGQSDAESICNQVNASFAAGSAMSVDALVEHRSARFVLSTPGSWLDDGSRAEVSKWRSDSGADATVASAFAAASASLDEDVASWRDVVRTESGGAACTVDVTPTTLDGDDARRIDARCAGGFDLHALSVSHDGRLFDASCVSRRGDDAACSSIVSSLRLHP